MTRSTTPAPITPDLGAEPARAVHSDLRPGLEGVVAAETLLSHVDGEAGELLLAGYPVEELAPNARFEETIALFLGEPLGGLDATTIGQRLAAARELPERTRELVDAAAARAVDPMSALAMAVASLALDAPSDQAALALRLVAAGPTIVGRYWRTRQDLPAVEPRRDLSQAGHFLHQLEGSAPAAARTRALDTYWNTVVDHGMNASTFTARVITSTGSDLVSAIVGAIGALKGPLHGGAPGPALDLVLEIGDVARAEAVVRARLARGERLMGFGHRIYRVRDPRADVLAAAAQALAGEGESLELYELARGVEAVILRLLEEAKPGRRIQTNVEFYTALLLHALGLPKELFATTFALGRTVGWLAHCFEQRATGRLIRPQSVHVGPRRSLSAAAR
jgi:citrate synthase